MNILLPIIFIFTISDENEITNHNIHLTPQSINLEKTLPGQINDVTFSITNHNANSIKITNTQSSCGCVSLDIPNKTIAPNEQIIIKSKIASPVKDSTYRLVIELTFDQNIKIPLQIIGETKSLFTVEPDKIVKKNIKSGDVLHMELYVKRTNNDYVIKDITTECDFYKINNVIINPIMNNLKCTFDLNVVGSDQWMFSEIVLHTNHPIRKKIEIPVVMSLFQEYFLEPSSLFFGVCKANQKFVRTLKVTDVNGEFLEISTIKSNDGTKVALSKSDTNETLNIELITKGDSGFQKGYILLKPINKKISIIKVPFSYILRK